jgi:hypothetical protein
VQTLERQRKEIAVNAYREGIKTLFLCGTGLAILMMLVQAGSGWKAPVKSVAAVDAGDVEGEEALAEGA